MTSRSYYEGMTENDAIKRVYGTGRNLNVKYEVERSYGIQKQTFEEWVIPQLALVGTEKVLDVGCGQGRFLLPIARFMKDKGGHIIGCDIAEGVMHFMLSHLQARKYLIVLSMGTNPKPEKVV